MDKKVREENGPEKCVGSWEGHVAVRLRFRLRSGSAGRKVEDVIIVLEREEFDQDI